MKAMEKCESPVRLAIAIYDSIGELCAPLASLINVGIGQGQLGILADKAVITKAALPEIATTPEGRILSGLVKATTPATLWHPEYAIMISPDVRLLIDRWTTQGRCSHHVPRETETTRRVVELCSHLDRGHAALAVKPITSAQHRRCIQLLLASSQYPVEAHEFTC